jgi:hypothetical protein
VSEPSRFEKGIDRTVDGLLRGIAKIPTAVIGVGLGIGFGWLIDVVSTAGPVDFPSDVDGESAQYDRATGVLAEPAPAMQSEAASTPQAQGPVASQAAAHSS